MVDQSLAAGFAPVFDEVAAGAVSRERERGRADAPVRALLDAGFGRIRVPADAGGLGASLPESFALIRQLAAADSNVAQIFRAHFAFIEARRLRREQAGRWFDIINGGALFGAAMTERSDANTVSTTLVETPEGWRLNGTKYYSTGTIYADWIVVMAANEHAHVHAVVPADAPGVTRIDDWDGFGQRMTGSGTTVFDKVLLPPGQILAQTALDDLPAPHYLAAYYQHYHNATLAGIAQAALEDALAYTRGRTRSFGVPGKASQKDDPIVQNVVGRLSVLAFSTAAIADHAAQALARAEPYWDSLDLDHPAIAAAQEAVFKAQQIIIEQTLEAASLLFEVGGASAVSESRQLDRHWRNARVLAAHNPAAQRQRELGDLALNGRGLWSRYLDAARQAQHRQLRSEPA